MGNPYTMEFLLRGWRAGQRPRFLFFYGHIPANRGRVDASCFSQWFQRPVSVRGVIYTCAEQYIMARKALLFGDSEIHRLVMAVTYPGRMRALGRQIRGFNQKIWDQNKYWIAREVNLAKFSQNKSMQKFLLSTEDRILVEAAPNDSVWGIGCGKSYPTILDPTTWRGKNILGFVLTDVRDELAIDLAFS